MIVLHETTRVGSMGLLQGRVYSPKSKSKSKGMPRFPDGSLFYRYFRSRGDKGHGLTMTTDGEYIYIDLVDAPRRWRDSRIPYDRFDHAVRRAENLIKWWGDRYERRAHHVAAEFNIPEYSAPDMVEKELFDFVPKIDPVARRQAQVARATVGDPDRDASEVVVATTGARTNVDDKILDELKLLKPSTEEGFTPDDLPEGQFYLVYEGDTGEVSVNNLEANPELVITGTGRSKAYWAKGNYIRMSQAIEDGEMAAEFFRQGKSVDHIVQFFIAKYGSIADNAAVEDDGGDWD